MGRIIAGSNHKGGVGKSTSIENLALALVKEGYTVAVVDIDANGDATAGLGVDPESVTGRTIFELVITQEVKLDEVIIHTKHGVDLIPANDELAAAEVILMKQLYQNARDWRTALKPIMTELAQRYDFVLVDCPPNLGLLVMAVLIAADEVLIPCACQYRSYRAIPRLLKAIKGVKDSFNSGLRITGILPTMYAPSVVGLTKRKTGHSHEVLESLRSEYGARGVTIFEPIKHSVRYQETAIEGVPAVDYAPEVAEGYINLAKKLSGKVV